MTLTLRHKKKNLTKNHVILYPKIKTRAHVTILKSYRTLVDNMLKTVKILVKTPMGFKIVSQSGNIGRYL